MRWFGITQLDEVRDSKLIYNINKKIDLLLKSRGFKGIEEIDLVSSKIRGAEFRTGYSETIDILILDDQRIFISELMLKEPDLLLFAFLHALFKYAGIPHDIINELMILICDEWLKSYPENVGALYYKGLSFSNQERYKEALENYSMVTKINPKITNTWFQRGYALCELGQYREALTCFDKVLKFNPKHVQAWYYKAFGLYEIGDYQGAIRCFKHAIKHENMKAEEGTL